MYSHKHYMFPPFKMAEYTAVSVLAFVSVLLATEVESVHRSKMNVGAEGRSHAPKMPMRPYDYSSKQLDS